MDLLLLSRVRSSHYRARDESIFQEKKIMLIISMPRISREYDGCSIHPSLCLSLLYADILRIGMHIRYRYKGFSSTVTAVSRERLIKKKR